MDTIEKISVAALFCMGFTLVLLFVLLIMGVSCVESTVLRVLIWGPLIIAVILWLIATYLLIRD